MNFTAVPSPPSPTTSSPGLTQSTSNSSSSPPPVFTPPRQPKPRYPNLGRVPLHRRGTSQTYERLEDLLREAGYKETRVFTPESERLESQKQSSDSSHSNGKKQGVGATVVGFLTGLVTGGTATTTQLTQQPTSDDTPDHRPRLPRVQSSSSSPFANRQSQHQEGSHSAESSGAHTPMMTSSIESLGGPTPKPLHRYPHQHPQRPPSRPTTPGANAPAAYPAFYNQPQYHAPLATQQHHRLSAAQRSLQKQASRSSFQTHTSIASSSAMNPSSDQGTIPCISLNDNNNNTANGAHQPQPSRAGAYLRHMVSTPTINAPPRPNSTPPRAHHHPRKRTIHEDSDGTDAESTITIQPPLPRKWLDSVAKALLLGAAIAPPTQPNHKTNITSSTSSFLHPNIQQRVLRQTRSSLSQTTLGRSSKPMVRRSGLLDQTNVSIHTVLNPPALFTRLERGRAPCSQSVLKAQVVCRSAPGSRTPSLVRQDSMIGGDSRRAKGDKSGSGTGKSPRRQQPTGGKTAGRAKGTRRNNNKKQGEEKTRVPSLARTRIEGDVWHIASIAHSRRNNTHPHKRSKSKDKLQVDYFSDGDYLYDQHSTENDEDFYASDYDEDEDEDEGELDLARMLTHPKRQNSIRSLRKHLHSQLTSPSAPDVPSTYTTTKANHSPHPGLRKGSVGGARLSSGGQFRLGGMEEETDESGGGGGGEQWRHQWSKGGHNGSRKASEDDEEPDGFPWLRDLGSKSSNQRSASAQVRSPGPRINSNASMR